MKWRRILILLVMSIKAWSRASVIPVRWNMEKVRTNVWSDGLVLDLFCFLSSSFGEAKKLQILSVTGSTTSQFSKLLEHLACTSRLCETLIYDFGTIRKSWRRRSLWTCILWPMGNNWGCYNIKIISWISQQMYHYMVTVVHSGNY